jgi:1,4-alpha-glucan branching enzyme
VLLDWVPAHFPTDVWGLAQFDGTHLYEYADRREGFHNDWNTLIYNFGRTEVRNFLVGNALYWLERYNVDGLRVDAVASMLYRDYSRKAGEWIPNMPWRPREPGSHRIPQARQRGHRHRAAPGHHAGRRVHRLPRGQPAHLCRRPGLSLQVEHGLDARHAEVHVARPHPSQPPSPWELTFGLIYAFTENFVLPISHDEVVHGKGSLLAKMPGDAWQKFANLRAYYGFMWGHPGKKLLFMGCEFAQGREWNHESSLDWHQLEIPAHAGVQRLVKDLNQLYRASPALYSQDFSEAGFEWIDHGDARRSLLSFVRKGREGQMMLVLCNFAPVVHEGLRLGVPRAGHWQERLNTDSAYYGGSNVGTP